MKMNTGGHFSMGICTYMCMIISLYKVSESHKTWALSGWRNSNLDDLSNYILCQITGNKTNQVITKLRHSVTLHIYMR